VTPKGRAVAISSIAISVLGPESRSIRSRHRPREVRTVGTIPRCLIRSTRRFHGQDNPVIQKDPMDTVTIVIVSALVSDQRKLWYTPHCIASIQPPKLPNQYIDLLPIVNRTLGTVRSVSIQFLHDVLEKIESDTRWQTEETATPMGVPVHMECQMIPLIAGVVRLRMMPQPKYCHQTPINDECNRIIDRYQASTSIHGYWHGWRTENDHNTFMHAKT